MRSALIVERAPRLDLAPRIVEGQEPVGVQALPEPNEQRLRLEIAMNFDVITGSLSAVSSCLLAA